MNWARVFRILHKAERRPPQIGPLRLVGLRFLVAVIWAGLVLWHVALVTKEGSETVYGWGLLGLGTFLALFCSSLLATLRSFGSGSRRISLSWPLNPRQRASLFYLESIIAIRLPLYGLLLLVAALLYNRGLGSWIWGLSLMGIGLGAIACGGFFSALWVLRPRVAFGLGSAALFVVLWWVQSDVRVEFRAEVVALVVWSGVLLGWLVRGAGGGLLAKAIESEIVRSGRSRDLKVHGWIASLLLRIRHPAGAFLFRQWQTRRRSGPTWGRLALTLVLLVAFPWLRPLLVPLVSPWLDPATLLLAYLNAAILVSVIDGSTAPFGAEGSRVQAWLVAPIPRLRVLWARWFCHAFPLAFGTGLAAACLGFRTALGGLALFKLVILSIGLQAFLSALVIALNQREISPFAPISGGAVGMLIESGPFTPVRLLTVTVLVFTLGVAVVLVEWLGLFQSC